MAGVALLGASGYTGRLVARALDARGIDFVAAGRSPSRVREAVDDLASAVDVRRVNVHERDTLDALCGDVDVLITTVGPFTELGRPALESAVRMGSHYLDSTGEQPFMRWAFATQARSAADAGVTAVPACGYDFVPGDLLAHLAAAAVPRAREIHASYLVRGPGMVWSQGTRRSIAAVMGGPSAAFEGERLVDEGVAEVRRLSWFPKPVGPRHAASFPGGEPLTVPRHVPDVETVRTYFAVPGILAEAGQFAANLVSWEPAKRLARRVLTAGSGGPSPERRRRVRWACVVEASSGGTTTIRPDHRGAPPAEESHLSGDSGSGSQPGPAVGPGSPGEQDAPIHIARAWAYGTDIYGFTAETLAAGAARLLEGDTPAGVVAPAEAFDPESFLDDLAGTAGIRWHVRRAPDETRT